MKKQYDTPNLTIHGSVKSITQNFDRRWPGQHPPGQWTPPSCGS
jgi:hypothetical protein